jgi:hypothetical protein
LSARFLRHSARRLRWPAQGSSGGEREMDP